MSTPLPYLAFVLSSIVTLGQVNVIVTEPYMDEPFHVPQAQAYCRAEFDVYDPKLTTPPGLYLMSLALLKVVMVKCTLPMLRFTTLLPLLGLPMVLTRLMRFHQRQRPPPSEIIPSVTVDAVILAGFPIVWFFGFLYYTEVPSLVLVAGSIVAATRGEHALAALLGAMSCTFRQTNIVWALYAFGTSTLMRQRFADTKKKLYDPMALQASLSDIPKIIHSIPGALATILPNSIPYLITLAGFAAFIVWNGGIVLGDKSNHIPVLHVPQVYYFAAFSAAFGWPVLLGAPGILSNVLRNMFGSPRRIIFTVVLWTVMAVTVNKFTIHHPFLLADNRHYTFYIWRRVYMLHPAVPYLLIPGYHASALAWFYRIAPDQTILQTLLLPVLILPTLLPTPLLEPRYFLIPYVLLRAQVPWSESKRFQASLAVEALWYIGINAVTMYVFLFHERAGVGRFMW